MEGDAQQRYVQLHVDLSAYHSQVKSRANQCLQCVQRKVGFVPREVQSQLTELRELQVESVTTCLTDLLAYTILTYFLSAYLLPCFLANLLTRLHVYIYTSISQPPSVHHVLGASSSSSQSPARKKRAGEKEKRKEGGEEESVTAARS
jgi:hypothetical protein